MTLYKQLEHSIRDELKLFLDMNRVEQIEYFTRMEDSLKVKLLKISK